MQNTLENTRFGAIEYATEDVFHFSEGLIGFANLTQFLLLAHSEKSPFRWLQSIEEPALAFLTAYPSHYISDFALDVDDKVAADLGLSESSSAAVLATVTIPQGRPNELTLNLAGPIVINLETRVGKQLIVDGDSHALKHRVFEVKAAA